MKKMLLFTFLIISLNIYAQVDTIYTNNNKIACSVKEITPEAVKFSYINEDLVNSIYKNTVQQIVFKSGRVQSFAEATSYKMVEGVNDFENVTLTQVESEVRGLYKLGDVGSKAKGTTTLSSMEKVKERAVRKMKIQAAMMGANIVYLTQNNTTGNQMGSQYVPGKSTETNLAGVSYSNLLPNYNDFNNTIGDKRRFYTIEKIKLGSSDPDYVSSDFQKSVTIQNIYNENGLIMVNANIEDVSNNNFRVIYFNKNEFTLMYKDDGRIYNFIVRVSK